MSSKRSMSVSTYGHVVEHICKELLLYIIPLVGLQEIYAQNHVCANDASVSPTKIALLSLEALDVLALRRRSQVIREKRPMMVRK